MNTVKNHDIAVIAVSEKGGRLGGIISEELSCDLYLPEKHAGLSLNSISYTSTKDVFKELFSTKKGIIAVMAQGIVTRMIAPHIDSKYTDPAVVTCDEVGRVAISTLSGHEGGANDLTYIVSSITGAEPVITTATEANKRYTIGIGCRKNTSSAEIVNAVNEVCIRAGISPEEIRSMSSAWVKKMETGMHEAAKELGLYLRFIPKEYLENPQYKFNETDASKRRIGVPAVAEPCALLSAKNPELIMEKQVIGNVTIAIAKEKLNTEGLI